MRRKLIINADDFGLTRGVNLAVFECAKVGMLRSATLMPNGEACDDAVNAAKGLGSGGFGIGIHFVLTGLRPVLPAEKLHGLAGPDGLLPSGPGLLLKKIVGRKSLRDDIKAELFAQAEKVFDSGLSVTHFDSHKHVHIIPMVLDILIEIARRFSVKAMRDPFEGEEAWRFFHDVEKNERVKFIKQYMAARAAGFCRPYFRARVRKAGIQTPAVLYGISPTGLMNEKIILRICRMLGPGTSELMTHPGIVDADLRRSKTRLLGSRAKEKDLLMSRRVKEMFERHQIIFGHFGEVNR
jgi:predicted glycoside hydrolase/deacetylase ChbG (UPF0249 family)